MTTFSRNSPGFFPLPAADDERPGQQGQGEHPQHFRKQGSRSGRGRGAALHDLDPDRVRGTGSIPVTHN